MKRVTVTIGDESFDDWSPDRLTFGEADMIERAFGGSMGEWGNALARGSAGALKVLAFSLLRRKNPGLRIKDLDDLPLGDVQITSEDDDLGKGETDSASSEPATSESSPISSASDPGSGTV